MLPREALSLSGDVFNLDTSTMLMDMEIVVDPFGEPFQFELLAPPPDAVPGTPSATSAVDGDTSSTGGDDDDGRRAKGRHVDDDNDGDDNAGASCDDGRRGTKRDRKALELPAEGMQAVLPKHVELELESLDEFDECGCRLSL